MVTPTTCDQSRRRGHEDHQDCFSFIPSIIARSGGKNKYCEQRVTDVQSVRVLNVQSVQSVRVFKIYTAAIGKEFHAPTTLYPALASCSTEPGDFSLLRLVNHCHTTASGTCTCLCDRI